MSQPNTKEDEVEHFYENVEDLLELTPNNRDGNAKVGSQETPGVTCNLAMEYRMKQGKG